MGGVDAGGVEQLAGQPVGRVVLAVDQVAGVRRAEQVGPADRAVQQRSAGEDPDDAAGRAVRNWLSGGFHGVRKMGEGVARRGDHPDPEDVADGDEVAVAQRHAVEAHRVVGVDVVRRAGSPCQGEVAGDVVVVQVRLEDVCDGDAFGDGEVEDPVDVALRVDDERGGAVVDEVAAIAERRGVERQDPEHRTHSWGAPARRPRTIG
jgi:hypothetical protein